MILLQNNLFKKILISNKIFDKIILVHIIFECLFQFIFLTKNNNNKDKNLEINNYNKIINILKIFIQLLNLTWFKYLSGILILISFIGIIDLIYLIYLEKKKLIKFFNEEMQFLTESQNQILHSFYFISNFYTNIYSYVYETINILKTRQENLFLIQSKLDPNEFINEYKSEIDTLIHLTEKYLIKLHNWTELTREHRENVTLIIKNIKFFTSLLNLEAFKNLDIIFKSLFTDIEMKILLQKIQSFSKNKNLT